jgi:hypothetical protein
MPTETSATNRMLAGKCECGAVRYRVADAFLYAANCHCSNCRASTGSAFKAFAGIEREKLEITAGVDTLLVWGDDDANHTRCAICGSLLYSVVRHGATCMSRWDRSPTTRRSAQPNTSSSARRRPGSRSRTTCRNPTSTSQPATRYGRQAEPARRPSNAANAGFLRPLVVISPDCHC